VTPRRPLLQRVAGRVRRLAGKAYSSTRQVAKRMVRGSRKVVLKVIPDHRIDGIPSRVLAQQRLALTAKRSFGPHDLERLERLLRTADEVVTLREGVARKDNWPERFLALRHDMDHDVENSVRFAEWEAAHGFRSTYFVLHTDWYHHDAKTGEPSKLVLKALDRIASLGHEIALHNNVITAALITGGDPMEILASELGGLRRHGFDIVGSVAHGDKLCHTLGYVNNEVFAEVPHPDLGASDRTIEHADAATGRRTSVTLKPAPMADFGLLYEGNTVGQTLYLSDTGGRWSRPFDSVARHYASEGGYLQVMTHPVWWALQGEAYRPRPSVEAAPADPTTPTLGEPGMTVVVRGDCCSRRGILMNEDLFGGSPVVVKDEKARTDFFLDHDRVGSASQGDIRALLDVDAMGGSLREYALHQTDRDTLDVTGARLLVMDDYSDMNFAAWRNRQTGWSIWVHPKFIRDRGAFDAAFEPLGRLSFDQSLRQHVALIEAYRTRNGQIPVLFLHQPTALYRKLDDRAEFRRLGSELEKAVPNLYFGDLDDRELEPDDLGSCGPGQTLHFTGPTYRKMFQVALDKGLRECLK
jgi:hypothetical protein